jgi:hypothetical protein
MAKPGRIQGRAAEGAHPAPKYFQKRLAMLFSAGHTFVKLRAKELFEGMVSELGCCLSGDRHRDSVVAGASGRTVA